MLDLLKETCMMGCKPIDTHMDPRIKLEIREEDKPMDIGRYQRLVYLAYTRPDTAFSVSCISQFMHLP